MIWHILALFIPCLMVIIFAQITRNKWIGFFLSVILIGMSIYKGFFNNEYILVLDVISLVAGFYIVDKLDIENTET